jgi:hypothetical protein
MSAPQQHYKITIYYADKLDASSSPAIKSWLTQNIPSFQKLRGLVGGHLELISGAMEEGVDDLYGDEEACLKDLPVNPHYPTAFGDLVRVQLQDLTQ